jgi:molybdopterin/thiamine biosynthesis adenylyltransferase
MLDVSRHKELFNPATFTTPVTIIGAGATGSWLALILAKLGITNITVWDFDRVEAHNIANQIFFAEGNGSEHISDIGCYKVNALKNIVANATGTQINIVPNKYINEHLSGIVFLMVDSMAERKRIWQSCIKLKPAVKLLIEPRMGLDVGRVYNVVPTDLTHIREYENTYYGDDTAEVSACGNSMTVITTAMTIAAFCGRQLINFHAGIEIDNEILLDLKYNNIIPTKW